MQETGSWPTVLVVWKSKAQETYEAAVRGQVSVHTGKGLHLRKGAQFVLVVEDGRLLASGQIAAVSGYLHDLHLDCLCGDLASAVALPESLAIALKGIPRPFLKGPVSAVVIPPDKDGSAIGRDWFDAAVNLALKTYGSTPQNRVLTEMAQSPVPSGSPIAASPTVAEASPSVPAEPQPPAAKAEPGDEKETLLKSWIPPALGGLLEDHVRADEWEMLAALAFRALGCKVEIQGRNAVGKALPDCIVRYTSPAGQLIELVVDAKAGRWTGSIDDIRAMRDYIALSASYSFPLFVANSLARGVGERLHEQIIHGKTARAISGRDLALLIVRRFTDPSFNVEFELRRIFL